MFLRKAMRYYRLWIYSASALILLGALLFILAALFVRSDWRFSLLLADSSKDHQDHDDSGGSQLLLSAFMKSPREQPFSFVAGDEDATQIKDDFRLRRWDLGLLFGLLSLALQLGPLQAIGCYGAVRMRERWIQAFWYLILGLALSDLGALVYWLARYDLVTRSLRHHLIHRLHHHYGYAQVNLSAHAGMVVLDSGEQLARLDKTFSELLDKMQAEAQCCGILGPLDYSASEWRRRKLRHLNLTSTTHDDTGSSASGQQVPLVPAACCRSASSSADLIISKPKPPRPKSSKAKNDTSAKRRPPDLGGSPGRRRLLAKQENYNLRPPDASGAGDSDDEENGEDGEDQDDREEDQEAPGARRERRWLVEERVDEGQQVLAWLTTNGDSINPESNEEEEKPKAERKLEQLRRLLFRNASQALDERNFRAQNGPQLTYGQYKTIESYLSNFAASSRRLRRHPEEQQQQTLAQTAATLGEKEDDETRKRLKGDAELQCLARTYYDQQAIYTRGCLREMERWFHSSAHLLFVFGFCILTVLKLCALLLLRLELREMIHKIRVLKGMATEFNALHDLEAYLPRPSVCAQAAELTPSGVAAVSSPTATTDQQQPPPPIHVPRLGGSFSEAVAAAQARQHQLFMASASAASAHNPLKASSMRAMAAQNSLTVSGGGEVHARSASHLHQLASAACQTLSPGACHHLFQPGSPAGCLHTGRRHTAISVCPAAAAAAAAVAAQHLMSRRGTYVGAQPAPLLPPLLPSGLAHLGQHRHSAHTVSPPPPRPMASPSRRPQLSADSSAESPSARSGLSAGSQQQQEATTSPRASTSSQHRQQLLSLASSAHHLHPFKRQWSGGGGGGGHHAHSSALDLERPAGAVAESRRSIH